MSKNKTLTIIMLSIVTLLVFICTGCKKNAVSYDKQYSNELSTAPFYKIEKIYPNGEDSIIANEPFLSLGSLNVVNTDVDPGKILYRITFNCKEMIVNGNEIVMEVGEKSFIIEDHIFGFSSAEQYDNFLELIESKYQYYLNN